MDHDEQELVVLRAGRQRMLRGEQLIQVQVLAVSKRHQPKRATNRSPALHLARLGLHCALP
jgi:hypothetical protein